jgi:hypothetical protein
VSEVLPECAIPVVLLESELWLGPEPEEPPAPDGPCEHAEPDADATAAVSHVAAHLPAMPPKGRPTPGATSGCEIAPR